LHRGPHQDFSGDMSAPPNSPPVATGKAANAGRNPWRVLRWGFPVAVAIVVLIFLANANANRIRPSSIDKAVHNNARQLAMAADHYFKENGVTTCAFSDLVGQDKYVKTVMIVARETYPTIYARGVTVRVTGVAGVRTVTFAP
jgi:type IV pilus assembly protein PilA